MAIDGLIDHNSTTVVTRMYYRQLMKLFGGWSFQNVHGCSSGLLQCEVQSAEGRGHNNKPRRTISDRRRGVRGCSAACSPAVSPMCEVLSWTLPPPAATIACKLLPAVNASTLSPPPSWIPCLGNNQPPVPASIKHGWLNSQAGRCAWFPLSLSRKCSTSIIEYWILSQWDLKSFLTGLRL